ncbi:MAG: glycoside hydrolase family 2 TIM barrel-domain containing protein [Mucinivorans sp.]
MKNILVTTAAIVGSLALNAQIVPYTISENQLPPSTVFTTYRSVDAARGNVSEESENYTSLNGEWRMKFAQSSDQISKADIARHNKLDGWATIELPKAWQMAGEGMAIYSAKAYPFLSAAPKITDTDLAIQNSKTAIFARDMTVPFDYLDKALFLTIEGSSARTTLYINGEKVGMSTSSRSAAQFNITKFVERGLNRVVLVVDQYAKSSLLEDQTSWRLSGINRGVFMLAQPKIRMRDYLVSTRLDPTYENGLLETALLVKSELLNPHLVTIYYGLYDRHGKVVSQASREVTIGMRGEDTVRFTATIMGVDKWTAETPSLYTLVYRIKREGRFTENIARKVGFRSVEIVGNELLINGVKEQFRGVNLEEFDPKTGNVLCPETTFAELLKIKRAGINAIRTGGYPLPGFVYDMTDSLGFYVVSTANINAQGMSQATRRGGALANDPAWRDIFVERAIATYETGKNNPSIIAFALGESAGNGYCMYQAYLAIKARDTSRPVVYDGANAEWNTDVVCPLYPSIKELEKMNPEQPIIPSRVEFDPAYWQLKNTQGAFIDRLNAPSIQASGVKFAQLADDYKLTNKTSGVVNISSAGASMEAIGKLFAPIRVEKGDKAGVYRIHNMMSNTNLSYFQISYLSKNIIGKEQWITLPATECAPGSSVEVSLTGKASKIKIGNIYNSAL